jgi:hypothetical protein
MADSSFGPVRFSPRAQAGLEHEEIIPCDPISGLHHLHCFGTVAVYTS